MKTSESIDKISLALVAMQAESCHAVFDSKNPHFKNRYASLAEVIDTVKPVLAKHHLAVIQLPAYRVDIGPVLCTRILHESGQWIEEDMMLNPVKNDPQGIGSALTYSRRYSIPGVCLIASEEDDDGQSASRPAAVVVDQELSKMVLEELNRMTSEDQVRNFFKPSMAKLGLIPNTQGYSDWGKKFSAKVAALKANIPIAA